MMKKYAHIPDKMHGAIFTHIIERLVPSVRDVASYRIIRSIFLWLIRIAAVLLAVALSAFLIWLWVVKLVVLGGTPGQGDNDEELLDADEGHRNIMFEETGAGIKKYKL